jgi:hypothetical protein
MRPKCLMLAVLPALALLAACGGNPRPIAAAPPPPPPALSGAIVAPSGSTVVYSGSSVAPGVAPAGALRLSASDTLALLANNTAVGLTDAGVPYHVFFANNGVARFREETVADSGNCRVLPDGTVCSSLTRVSRGSESCYGLARYGDVIIYQRPDGVALGSIRVVAGNPQNL